MRIYESQVAGTDHADTCGKHAMRGGELCNPPRAGKQPCRRCTANPPRVAAPADVADIVAGIKARCAASINFADGVDGLTVANSFTRTWALMTAAEKKERGLEWVVDMVVQLIDDTTLPRYCPCAMIERATQLAGNGSTDY